MILIKSILIAITRQPTYKAENVGSSILSLCRRNGFAHNFKLDQNITHNELESNKKALTTQEGARGILNLLIKA
ncbi:CLUMA_CG010842, isoform A [Clunio marinus]|uniref:CLUMA_CG010842, isoform A n=1 Tax=Clunio marinus TaxID=568069 RepID=A0A1J1IAZ0_9DIPT|nr:CLUMA_CG010842, isoform A [Clunio marinus]